MAPNEAILEYVEQIGGGYIWDAEAFAITLLDIDVTDTDVERLSGLTGVQQIAINADKVSFEALQKLAQVGGLNSIVLENSHLDAQQFAFLQKFGPNVEILTN